jgi:hypothetical protein
MQAPRSRIERIEEKERQMQLQTKMADGKPLNTDRAALFKTAALGGRGTVVGLPTITGNPAGEVKQLFLRDLAGVSEFDATLEDMQLAVRQGRLSQEDLNKWRADERAKHSSALRDTQAKLQAARAKTAAAREKILTVPPLAINDAVTALRDNEIRAAVRAMGNDQRTRLMGEVGAGQHREVLHAIARDPVPGSPLGESGRAFYQAFQKKAEAPALAALDAEDEGHSGIEASLVALQKLVSS